MNTIQVAASNPAIYVRKKYQPHHFLSAPLGLSMNANPLSRNFPIPRAKPSSGIQCVRQSTTTATALKVYPRNLIHCVPVLKSRKSHHVCLAGGKGMMDNSEDSQRKSLEEAMKNLQEKIQKGEYGGGSGSKPPGGRGRGGGGSNSDGSEEGSFGGISDETLQIVFATIGFLVVYIYVINGVELTKLARDFIKYLLGGTQSIRLKRASYKWARLYKKITGQTEVEENGLEKAPTQWNITDFYRGVLRNYMKLNSNE